MHIARIALENWKNFSRVDVACGMRVFLIGPNAAGKSNFLDALRFMRDVTLHGLSKAVADLRGGVNAVRHADARKNAGVTLALDLDAGWRYLLSFGARARSGDAPLVFRETVVDPSGRTLLDRPDTDDRDDPPRLRQTALEQVFANRAFRDVAEFLAGIEYRSTLPQLVREGRSLPVRTADDDPFGGNLLAAIWNTPEKTRDARMRRIADVLRLAVPRLRDLRVVRDANGAPHFSAEYGDRRNAAHQDETSFSDGMLRLVALLWALQGKGGPLLLEEPELSLHESVVALLPGFFAQIDADRKKVARQIFVTTHADALLRDPGVGPGEVLRFAPGGKGSVIEVASEEERMAMEAGGLTAADVLLPRTRPGDFGPAGWLE